MPRQAASVILLRGGDRRRSRCCSCKRNPAARFMGGAWVFPGGAVDADEGEGDAAHRAARVRELDEEAGDRRSSSPTRWSRSRAGSRPQVVKIRFDTHFFLAPAPGRRRAAARRRGDRRPRLVHAARRARRPPRRRDPARLPDDQAPRAARLGSRRPTRCSQHAPRPRGRAGAAAGRSCQRRDRARPAARRPGLRLGRRRAIDSRHDRVPARGHPAGLRPLHHHRVHDDRRAPASRSPGP